jgi:hypothetical protein
MCGDTHPFLRLGGDHAGAGHPQGRAYTVRDAEPLAPALKGRVGSVKRVQKLGIALPPTAAAAAPVDQSQYRRIDSAIEYMRSA